MVDCFRVCAPASNDDVAERSESSAGTQNSIVVYHKLDRESKAPEVNIILPARRLMAPADAPAGAPTALLVAAAPAGAGALPAILRTLVYRVSGTKRCKRGVEFKSSLRKSS